jgi:hypothetical protein
MLSLSPKHYALIAGCALGIGAMTSAMHDWSEVAKPSFIGGVLGVLGTQIMAILSDKPHQ